MIKKTLVITLTALIFLLLYVAYGRKSLIISKGVIKARYALPCSKFINWNGCEIHYTDEGKGIPVLMIHGFGGSTRDFRYVDSLINDKYRVIRVDLPGFGLSDFPKKTVDDPDYNKMYSDFFNYFIKTLHIDSMYVIGNSMGGMAAWDLSVQHPDIVKKLVLVNSAGYDLHNIIKVAGSVFRFNWIRTFFKRGLPKALTRKSIAKCLSNTSLIQDDKVAIVNDLWNKEGNIDVFFDLATTSHWLDTSLIKKVSCPTLILWGKEDRIIPVNHADRFHRDIKNSREIIYSPCGHVPMIERPLDVQRDVLKFFTEQ